MVIRSGIDWKQATGKVHAWIKASIVENITQILKSLFRDFPDSPVVRTQIPLQGDGFDPWSGN